MEKGLESEHSMIMLKSDMNSITYQIPVKGLQAVYLACERRQGRCNFVVIPYYYELVFCYEDGTYFSIEELIFHEKDFSASIREYEDSVKIYTNQKMKETVPLFCPLQRLRAEEPFVKKEVMEKLNTLCDGNRFWRLDAKRRNKYDGNQEVEVTLCGTALAWLIWLVWLCLSVYLFFYISTQSELSSLLVLLGAGLYYYLFFVRSSQKIVKKVKPVFYEAIFGRNKRMPQALVFREQNAIQTWH